MVPSLAHIHTERPVQSRDLFGALSHEIFRCYSGQLLPLLLLNLQPLLVHAAPLPLLVDEVATAPARVWRWAGIAGIMNTFRELKFGV